MLATACLIGNGLVKAQNRDVTISSWRFSRDSVSWQAVRVPHDWAISGPFDKKWDLQKVAIEQNGEKVPTEKSGRSGALPWIGEGWYRTDVVLDKGYSDFSLEFDGAMSEPVVYVNGRRAGSWAYGYNAFRIDTAAWHAGTNAIVVCLRNREESSRWYPGAGLYRPVTLLERQKMHVDRWESFLRVDTITSDGDMRNAEASLHVALANAGNDVTVSVRMLDARGRVAASASGKASGGAYNTALSVSKAHLWSPETPYIYKLVVTATAPDGSYDTWTRSVGLRTVRVDSAHGFMLNGAARKIKGVCLHHDLGLLGAAVNRDAIVRQIELLKGMGADAIRTSHNMPSQMQMDVCDSLGMMVMAESFDMWKYPKCKNGYALFFDRWADRDIENLVKRNRNHPSLIMYSIGNEIPEQWSAEGRRIAQHLQDVCHSFDPTVPVTQGMDKAENALKSGFAQVMDVPGFNYRVFKYGRNIKQLPKGFLLGSETASTVSSRGVYKFPVEWSNKKQWPDGQCNGYDTEWCSWSNLPEEDFMAQEDAPYTIGQFVWTGFDYLGEPTPYDTYWPSRSSYFGIFDLAGLPKDRYYLYRSVWNRSSHTLHLLPHWTWPGREGKVTPVFCYTDWPSAELFVNGKSHGRQSKDMTQQGEWTTGHAATPQEAQQRARRYRLMWNDVVYEPGELKVVAYDDNGRRVAEETVRTAGSAARLKLEPYYGSLRADGESMDFITVTMTDASGNMVPYSADELSFKVSGGAVLKGACNGDATSLEPLTGSSMKLFSGQLVVGVQSNGKDTPARIEVTDKDNKKIVANFLLKVKK